MRVVNMQDWPRREHFLKFSAFNHPHFGMTANIDLTLFRPYVKQVCASITVAVTYVLARTANAIPEFRYRIQERQVVEHEVVHPSITVLGDEDLFSFCLLEYSADFSAFAKNATEMIAFAKGHVTLTDPPGKDNLLFMTVIPWVSFTSFMHPMQFHPADSVPRFAWGKLFEENDRAKMPLGVQAHHALMDGIHMARFYSEAQENFNHPEEMLGEG